ncbi:MAG: LuxR C-terminal-related transcriptional regulator [Myxococcales bacterium]
MESVAGWVALGQAALSKAQWPEALLSFERALTIDAEAPDALDGLSEARWWLGLWSEAREARECAYTRHRALGDSISAARAAIWLGNDYLLATGNRAAWNGWLERAATLLEGQRETAEYGWLLFTRGRRETDMELMASACQEALALARRLGDVDLELVVLSQYGRALVAQGRSAEGFARLDESMAAVMAGEQRNFLTVSETCCNMLATCEGAAEMERLAHWCRVTDEVSRRLNGQQIYSICRLNYASVLLALGRFEDAEQELLVGLATTLHSYPAYALHSYTRLAELRVAQGRLAEAAEYLAGHEENAACTRALAKLYLARGEAKQASKVLERRLSLVSADTSQSIPLYALLTEAELAVGDVPAAARAARELSALAARTERPAVMAAAEYATGLVALAEGESRAWVHFEAALARFSALEMPFETARARLAMARSLASTDVSGAIEIARRARAEFERLGAASELDRSGEVLRELGAATGPGKRVEGPLSEREGEVLAQLSQGLSNAEIGQRLFISPKTVEHHVSKILAKLGLKNRAAAAAYAHKHQKTGSAAK